MNFFKSNSQSISMSSTGNNNTVIVNGVKHTLPSGNVSIVNGNIYLNNVLWDGSDVLNENCKPLEITIQGDCGSLSNIKGNVTVNGNVDGNVEANGSMTIEGYVNGNVSSGGSTTCGNVGKNASSGGSMNCGSIGGNANSGGSMNRR